MKFVLLKPFSAKLNNNDKLFKGTVKVMNHGLSLFIYIKVFVKGILTYLFHAAESFLRS